MKEDKNIYPRFIPNKPCGIDKFEGKSQERLTNAIANHIVSTDSSNHSQNHSRIIGLEGSWGVGKSNVIKLLENHESLKNYHLFEYDAWGHQEDLQRRSFLEALTRKLISDNILTGKVKTTIDGITQKITWEQKLDNLLARKVVRINKSLPKFNAGALWTALAIAMTPFTVFIAERLESADKICNIIVLTTIAFAPILIGLLLWGIFMIKNKDMRSLGYLLKISRDENIETKNIETINEDEPNVFKFKAWMQDISNYIGENKKPKLIVVYDNMDRLPADKVKELWSSIHTFFSEDGFDGVWTIIPFDEQHLSCAFGEVKEEKEQLTKYFISKTFPVVYRVTPPVITDFKKLFDKLFVEAFADTESKQQDDINRIFRLEKPNATVREMIEYINQLVAIKNIWHNEIDILYIAIFTLKKDEILSENNLAEQILSGNYLGNYILEIVPNDEILQKNISALAYGISLDISEQIPMSKYIDSCFNLEENTDINRYANSNSFIHILNDKIKNSDIAQINNVILCLSQLNTDDFSVENKNTIATLWNTIAKNKMKDSLAKQEFDNNFKLVLLNIDDSYKREVIKYLCKQIQSFKEFISENYYNALKELEDFLKLNNINIKVTDNLSDLEKEPEVFVDYVLCTKGDYLLYKMKAKLDALSIYLSDRVTDKYSVLEVLKYLIDDKNYKFDKVKTKIEETIQNQQLVKEGNFKPLLDAYKILSDDKPLKVQLNQAQRQDIWNTLVGKPNTTEFIEILAIQIANGINVGSISCDNEQIKYIADNLDYYANYGELLVNNISWNIPILNQALKYMTENKLGYILSLEKVLPSFFNISTNIGVSESVLLEQFDDWEGHKSSITKNNIQSIFQNIPQFFQFSKTTKNVLTDYLNATIVEALSDISTDTLYQQRQQPNYFWNTIIKNLIDTDFLKPLPNNLTELGKKYIDDIAASRIAIPNVNDIIYKLIEKLDRRKTKETITNIKNQICNNLSGYGVDANKFLFLHKWLEDQGDLLSRAGDTCQYILSPIANNDSCLKIMVENTDFYANIINSAETQADTFKSSIKIKLSKSADENLISFAKKLGIEKD